MDKKIEILLEPLPPYVCDGANVYIRQGDHFASEIKMEPYAKGTIVSPLMTISGDMAQQLCDNLWRLGYRPSRAQDASPVIEAKQQHIDDLRAVLGKAGRM